MNSCVFVFHTVVTSVSLTFPINIMPFYRGWGALMMLRKSESEVMQSFLILCDRMDCSPPGSSVHGILQARILEWLPCSPPGDLLDPGIEPMSLMTPALVSGFFTTSATWDVWALGVCRG